MVNVYIPCIIRNEPLRIHYIWHPLSFGTYGAYISPNFIMIRLPGILHGFTLDCACGIKRHRHPEGNKSVILSLSH